MEIYLVRHAEAVERAEGLEDGTRWLTPKGRKAMQRAACRLRKLRVQPELIITSPLTRAVQTAELLMHEAGKRTCLVANSLLAAEGAHQQIVELIRTSKAASVMLVGHEPLLSQTAALLLGKEQLPGFGKGSCLSLELRDSQAKSKFVWYAPRIGNIVKSLRKFLKESSA